MTITEKKAEGVTGYTASFFGPRRYREHTAKSIKGAVNWFRRNKWYVVEDPVIRFPGGTVKPLRGFDNEAPDSYFDNLIQEMENKNHD